MTVVIFLVIFYFKYERKVFKYERNAFKYECHFLAQNLEKPANADKWRIFQHRCRAGSSPTAGISKQAGIPGYGHLFGHPFPANKKAPRQAVLFL